MELKMKKIALILGICLAFNTNVRADVCYDVNDMVASNAVDIIQKQKEIYQYCSICLEAKSKTIFVKNVKKGNPVYVDDIALDLAHTYYKQDNKFINLGIASGCIQAGEYNIVAELESLSDVHYTKEDNRKLAKKQSYESYKKCVNESPIKEDATSSDMIGQSTKINDCLANEIKLEIEKGFNPVQQKEMLETLNKIRKDTWKFYFGIYAENKYCYGACGTMSNILPYINENKILIEMLEQVMYLNIAKNGY